MNGKLCVITGANSGIGRAMAGQIAALGARVVLVGRSAEKGREALDDLRRRTGSDRLEWVTADLSLRDEVRRAAAEIAARHGRVHVLVNNVGLYLPRRHVTREGFEVMFATNHLGVFLFTHALMDALLAAAPARVITVSSEGHRLGRIDFDDLQAERSFRPLRQYGATKLANILFTRELSRRFHGEGIVANAFQPGTVRTGFAQDEDSLFGALVRLAGPLMRTPEDAAETGTWLASSEEAARAHGAYFSRRRPRTPSRAARREDLARRLWDVTARLAGTAGGPGVKEERA